MFGKLSIYMTGGALALSLLFNQVSVVAAQDESEPIAPPVVVDGPAATETLTENLVSADGDVEPVTAAGEKATIFLTDKAVADETTTNEEVETKRSLYLPLIAGGNAQEEIDAAAVNAYWRTIEYENFEGVWPDYGWRTFDCNGSLGGWSNWDDENYKPYQGGWSAWPGGGGANGVDPRYYYYSNYACSEMRYGPFSLRYAQSAYLSFWYWNQSERNYDFLSWGYSCDGVNWVSNSTTGDSLGWRWAGMYVGCRGDSTVWIRFRFTSDYSNFDDGPFVDNVWLEEYR